jgi:hypothetical protein
MSKLLTACALALALVAVPGAARAADKEPAKHDALERVLAVLEKEVRLPADADVTEVSLFEIVQHLSKTHDLAFVINEKSFDTNPNIKETKPKVTATSLRGMHARDFLNHTLSSMNATFLVRRDHIEIVSVEHAAKETKSQIRATDGETRRESLGAPLISTIIKEKPLNEAVAKLAEIYDLNVIVSPQAGDARTGFVSARLLNVPADKALELLALQADLRVVKKGNAFVLTSKEHAEGMFNEKLDRERQKIELEKFREAPAAPPAPMPPAPPPQPKM